MNQRSYFKNISRDKVRQRCKANGTIKRYNGLESGQEEKKRKEKKRTRRRRK